MPSSRGSQWRSQRGGRAVSKIASHRDSLEPRSHSSPHAAQASTNFQQDVPVFKRAAAEEEQAAALQQQPREVSAVALGARSAGTTCATGATQA